MRREQSSKKEAAAWRVLQDQFAGMADYRSQTVKQDNSELVLAYLEPLVDSKYIPERLIKPYYENLAKYAQYLQAIGKPLQAGDVQQAAQAILDGQVICALDGQLFACELRKKEGASVGEAKVEKTVQGPKDTLSESLKTNLNLVRMRYPSTDLRTEELTIGTLSRTKVQLLYDSTLCHPSVLDKLRRQLGSLKAETVQSAGSFERLLGKRRFQLFPLTLITERPDRVILNLTQGKAVLLLDNSPTALVAPAVFYDYMSSMDDIYTLPVISKFLITLRYIGLFVTLFLPAFYIGIASFNPELFRVQLAFSIAGSRVAVPYPSFVEVIFMLVVMEMLIEASIRLPTAIGPTATTVGGLILGQAATQAGLVSDIMVIIVSAVAISNFIIPLNEMSAAMRVIKYGLILLATLYGLLGVMVGFIGLLYYMCNLRSYGQPYLKLHIKDKPLPASRQELLD